MPFLSRKCKCSFETARYFVKNWLGWNDGTRWRRSERGSKWRKERGIGASRGAEREKIKIGESSSLEFGICVLLCHETSSTPPRDKTACLFLFTFSSAQINFPNKVQFCIPAETLLFYSIILVALRFPESCFVPVKQKLRCCPVFVVESARVGAFFLKDSTNFSNDRSPMQSRYVEILTSRKCLFLTNKILPLETTDFYARSYFLRYY